MNTNTLARHYDQLNPEERFKLIFWANDRGDEVERDRLGRSGQRIAMSLPDHAPFAMAFQDVALVTLVEILNAVAVYLEALHTAGEHEPESIDAKSTKGRKKLQKAATSKDKPHWQRTLEIAYAHGFMFKMKFDGWKLFCERLNVPPMLLWSELPGAGIIERAARSAKQSAFTAERMLEWLNSIRPEGEAEVRELRVSVEVCAKDLEATYRFRAARWNAEGPRQTG